MVVLLSRLVLHQLQQIILNFNRLVLTINADHIILIPNVFYRYLVEVRSAGEEMVGIEVYPYMEAVKLKLYIRQKIFIS